MTKCIWGREEVINTVSKTFRLRNVQTIGVQKMRPYIISISI